MTGAVARRADLAPDDRWLLTLGGKPETWESSSSRIDTSAPMLSMPTGSDIGYLQFLGCGGPGARLAMIVQAAVQTSIMVWALPPAVLPPVHAAISRLDLAGGGLDAGYGANLKLWRAPGVALPTAAPTAVAAESPALEATTADGQMAAILEQLSLRMSDLADILGVARPTAYGYLHGDVLTPKDERAAARLRGMYHLALQWKSAVGEPMGRMWSLRLDETTPSLLEQLLADEWDAARLQATLGTLGTLQSERATRRQELRARGFGRGRESAPEDREVRRVEDAIRHGR